ncbi:MAG: hypothetical protein Dbin4_02993 [Alphaproteobacteria bacterium]|nr:hypothetical protein [Alphaproteobacteria bacterium]
MTGRLTDTQIVEDIINREGGYVDHRGGPANFGITLARLRDWRGVQSLTANDVRMMRRGEAALIYDHDYIRRPGFHLIADDRLRHHVIDFGAHSGPATAARKLQQVVGADQDGVIGPQTLNAIRRTGAANANNLLMAERIKLLGRLVSGDHSQAAFISEWLNRALEFMV